nr:unnamed protein product [Callosobruchus analis]CAI5848681.1 unnamed protein product [Callosobruchus analis]CAI5861208.1 unnamed protein product [Callosobruchus analis]CAI5866143.1 unnamed protein product [Callosobruchus analis]CAI5866994.1 unnamed protein product [Callosobruchus analis]
MVTYDTMFFTGTAYNFS